MTTYNEPTNVTGVVDMFSYANQVTDSIFGYIILLTVYIVIFLSLRAVNEPTKDSMIAAGFTTMFTAGMMFLMGLITGRILFLSIMSFALPLVWKIYS